MNSHRRRLLLVSVLIGALLAFLQAYESLACASRSSILIAVASSFGAGAAVAALVVGRRAS